MKNLYHGLHVSGTRMGTDDLGGMTRTARRWKRFDALEAEALESIWCGQVKEAKIKSARGLEDMAPTTAALHSGLQPGTIDVHSLVHGDAGGFPPRGGSDLAPARQ